MSSLIAETSATLLPSLRTAPTGRTGRQENIVKRSYGCLWFACVLMPLLGFSGGLYLYLQDDPEKRHEGSGFMMMAVAAMFMWACITLWLTQ